MKAVLSIAGTDPSGGAGIHADLKVFTAHRVYGMAAVTAVVAQNTCGVFAVEPVSPWMLEAQLDAVFGDIFPDAVKIGMLPDADSIGIVERALRKHRPRLVVIDPVLLSSSGQALIQPGMEGLLRDKLFPLATLITPNIPESETFCGFAVDTRDSIERAARKLSVAPSSAVLVKGGHFPWAADASPAGFGSPTCDDFLFDGESGRWFAGTRIPTRNTHGTGCALSSSIAANLALGYPVVEAVERAKNYLWAAISRGLSLGRGKGPIDLCP